MKQYDPYPALSKTAPAPPERSPLEPASEYGKRLKRWRTDNAKWAGQRRAVQELEVSPKQVKVPNSML